MDNCSESCGFSNYCHAEDGVGGEFDQLHRITRLSASRPGTRQLSELTRLTGLPKPTSLEECTTSWHACKRNCAWPRLNSLQTARVLIFSPSCTSSPLKCREYSVNVHFESTSKGNPQAWSFALSVATFAIYVITMRTGRNC